MAPFSHSWLKNLSCQSLWWRSIIMGFGVNHSYSWIPSPSFTRCVTLGWSQNFCELKFSQQKYSVMSASWVTVHRLFCSDLGQSLKPWVYSFCFWSWSLRFLPSFPFFFSLSISPHLSSCPSSHILAKKISIGGIVGCFWRGLSPLQN